MPGSASSEGFGINAHGQVVGTVTLAVGGTRAFLYSSGKMVNLGALGGLSGTSSEGLGINNKGQMTGSAYSGSDFRTAFIYRDKQMRGLRHLPFYSDSSGQGINDTGQVTGYHSDGDENCAFLDAHGTMHTLVPKAKFLYPESKGFSINNTGQITGEVGNHAFLYSRGKIRDLGTLPGYDQSEGQGINNHAEITGFLAVYADEKRHAFLYRQGTMRDLETLPGFKNSMGQAINDRGEVVGTAYNILDSGDRQDHAFIFRDKKMNDLNDLIAATSGWILESANSINSKGQITGRGKHDGKERAFVLTPQPTAH